MILKTFVKGMLENNNYLLIDEESKQAVLIDCSEYIPEVNDILSEYSATLKYILITHGHFDHVMGVNEFHNKFPEIKVLAPENDSDLINNIETFLDRFIGGFGRIETPRVDRYISEKDEIFLGKNKFKIISTPGHTKGSVCYFIDDKLFSGDTIFLESVGRTDLPGGSYEQIKNSVSTILKMFEDNVVIYTGHGDKTSVGHEKQNNPVI